MEFREISPDPALQPYIKCFWYARIEPALSDVTLEVLPNLLANVFITLSGYYNSILGNQELECRSGQVLLVGARTKLWTVVPKEPSQLIGIKFNPGGLYPFLKESLEPTANKIIDVSSPADGFFVKALQSLQGESAIEAELANLNQFFLEQVQNCPPPDRTIQRAVTRILNSKGQIRIDEPAREVDVGKRSLERYFLKHIGVSPKSISQIVRVRAAVEKILYCPEVNLAEVAFNLGFYDQAHLFNEIKDVMGKAPTRITQVANVKW